MSDLSNKDSEQDSKLVLIEHRLQHNEKRLGELRDRVRLLERWVWGAGAVISAAIVLIGFVTAVDSKEVTNGSNDTTQQEILLQF